MVNKTKATKELSKLTEIARALAVFQDENPDVLAAYDQLRVDLAAQTEVAREAVRQYGEPVTTRYYAATIQFPHEARYDVGALRSELPEVAAMPDVIVESVSKVEIAKAIKALAIPREALASVVREVALTPRVKISQRCPINAVKTKVTT